jgi:predicted PurR-regulated permease PerM
MKQVDNQPIRAYLALALAGVILYLAYLVFIPFFVPLFWGAVLGMLFYPLYHRLNRRLRGRSALSAGLLTVAVLFVVLIPALALGFQLLREAIELFEKVRQPLGSGMALFSPDSAAYRYLGPLISRLGFTSSDIHQAATFIVQGVGGFILTLASSAISNFVGLVVDVLLTLVALFFAFKDGPAFVKWLKRLIPLPLDEVEELFLKLRQVVRASVFSTFTVAAAQGLTGGLAFWGLGLSKPLLWGVLMGVGSLIPIIGSPVVWIPAAIYLAIIGEWLKAGLLLAAGTFIVGTIDNILRPLLIHGRVQISNFSLFFGILGGVYLTGFTGLLFGPVLISLLLTVLRIYEERHAHPKAGREPV